MFIHVFIIEAEYVFERRKPFLPIQVQAGYTPEGWLGILFGSKYRYTLSKPEKYQSQVEGLLGKVREIITGQQQPSIANDEPGRYTLSCTVWENSFKCDYLCLIYGILSILIYNLMFYFFITILAIIC